MQNTVLPLRPGDDRFDDEMAGFQTAFHHRPAVIFAVTSAEDVRVAVEYATAHELPVTVQATGHGWRTAAEGVLISTRRMDEIRIDPQARTAWIGAGVRSEELVKAAAEHGLAPVSGTGPGVGAVSFTLGGGLGLLARQFGYAADHVRRVEIVTGDGQLRQVTAGDELFWGLCGGRDGFGVVTALEIDLFPVTRIFGARLFFDTEHLSTVLHAYRDWTADVPEAMTSSLAMVPFPDFPGVPEPLRGRHIAQLRFCHTGTDGENLIAPFRTVPRLMENVTELPYAAVARTIFSEPDRPHGYHSDSAYLSTLDESVIEPLLDAVPKVVTDLRHLGGALSRPPTVDNSVSHRDAGFHLMILGAAADEDATEAEKSEAAALDVVAPWTVGRFKNLVYGKQSSTRPFHPESTEDRLAALRNSYDPLNLFSGKRSPATPATR